MQVVDAQVHIWGAKAPQPAGGEKTVKPSVPKSVPAPKEFDWSKDDLLAEMEAAGVHRAIIVPNSEGKGNDLALAAARAHPDRFRVMGVLKHEAPESRGSLASWREQPGMLGVRFNFRKDLFRGLLTEKKLEWVWAEAQAADVPIMFLARHTDMHFIGDVAQRYPRLKFTLDHLGLQRSGGNVEVAFRDFDQVLRLAEHPNVAVKVSALPLFTSDAYPFPAVHPYVRQVYDTFGPKRMFWGSDMTRLSCPYRQVVTMFTEGMPWLTAEDKEWVMGRGLCEWLGWK